MPSASFPTPVARVGGAKVFHPNFEGLEATCAAPPSSTSKGSERISGLVESGGTWRKELL